MKVSDDIRAQMLAFDEAAHVGKAKTMDMNVEIGRSGNPSYEGSSTYTSRDYNRFVPLNLVDDTPLLKKMDGFFVPCTTPSSRPTIDNQWKKQYKGVAFLYMARWRYDRNIPSNEF